MKHSFILLLFISNIIFGQDDLISNLDASYPEFKAIKSGIWENRNIWEGGEVPSDGAAVTIPYGVRVTITAELAAEHKFIQVEGNLFMTIKENTLLKVETLYIESEGYFRIGFPSNRVKPDKQAKIIFTSDDKIICTNWDKKQITRGLISEGKIEVYGKIKSHKLEFEQDIFAGQESITFNKPIPSDWEAGDELVIPGTSFVRDQPFEDEVLKISGISENTILLETRTQYNHIRLRDKQSLHLANLTRNVIFESESTDNELQRRGHMMFMNSNVKIEHAAFIGLGRTDKSKPLDDISIPLDDILARKKGAIPEPGIGYPVGPKMNVRGRYAVHFHKNGYGNDVNSAPSEVIGCVVRDTQGWGFVNHSSHVLFKENICYEFVGSGFVTESGDELGNFFDNIAIKGIGDGVYRPVRTVFSNPDRPQPLSDFAFSGEGFWFQGPAVRAVNNVAANCNGAGMFWFTLGSIEIGDNEMIGMPKDIALLAYAKHPGIETWNPRTWEHASNEVFMADLPILECSDFTGYANLAGFRIRMNNSSALSLFKSDFGGIDVFGYLPQIKPAAGYNKPGPAGRLNQNISNLELWNNEIGVRTRYSTKTRLDKVVVDNGLRYGNTIDVAPGIESQQAINDHEYLNTSISNYGVGLFIYKKNTDINNPGTSFEIESGNLKNTGNDLYNMDDSICADASSVKATDIISTSATINIAAHSELKRMVVRYKSEKDYYWNYTSIENSNSIELQDLYIDTEYAYQVLVGCEFSPSKWSEDKFFTTKCTDKTGGYKIGAEWTYGTFTAPACTGDKLRIRLRTGNGVGSSTYTKPNGDVVKGNSHNTLLINSVALDDFGTYTAEYIDQTGCISNYNFNVIPKNQPDDEPCDDNTPKISDISPIEFGLYPNPVLDNDVVSLSGEGIEYVEVFDMMGKWLNKQNFNAPESLVTINCSGFKSGIYFAKINGKEVLKFIYQR